MTCSQCDAPISLDMKFCVNCGSPVPKDIRICGYCKTELTPGNAFCEHCGRSYKNTLAKQTMFDLQISAPIFSRFIGRDISTKVTFTDDGICFTRTICKWWRTKHQKKENTTIPFSSIQEISNKSRFQWGWLILKCVIWGYCGMASPICWIGIPLSFLDSRIHVMTLHLRDGQSFVVYSHTKHDNLITYIKQRMK